MGGTRQPDPDDWSGPEDSGDPEDLGDDGLHDANNQLQPEDRPVDRSKARGIILQLTKA